MTVYIHRNKNNGKRYVGITETDPAKRWLGGAGYHRNKHFYDAIKLYGWDAFEHEIVAVDLTRDEAQKMERELIAKYKTQDKRYGYNITDGGEHFRHSDASKVLMSRNRKAKVSKSLHRSTFKRCETTTQAGQMLGLLFVLRPAKSSKA